MPKQNEPEDKLASYVNHYMGECFDGYLVVGFHRQNQDGVVVGHAPNAKSAIAINTLLAEILSRGGVACGSRASEE